VPRWLERLFGLSSIINLNLPKSTGMEILPFENWFNSSINMPILIAGPCSAESSDQVIKTARAIDKLNKVTLFRSGIWKPRTHPDSFNGVGVKGLKWMQQVKEETSLRTLVEVAVPKHVEQCINHEIDAVWIGARTTSSPFSHNPHSNRNKNIHKNNYRYRNDFQNDK